MKLAAAFIAIALAATGAANAEPYKEIPSEDRDAQPVRPPQPVYPVLAAYFGLSGRCNVRFNVDARGFARNVKPYCSHQAFCKSARDAVGDVVFKPKVLNGRAVPRLNVVYPLWYSFDAEATSDAGQAMIAAKEVMACESEPIS